VTKVTIRSIYNKWIGRFKYTAIGLVNQYPTLHQIQVQGPRIGPTRFNPKQRQYVTT
jgi:hypothetical protein